MAKSSLFTLAVIFFVLGGGTAFASGRTMCILGQCVLVISGDNLFNAKGIQIDSGTAKLIQQAPIGLFGLAGACLIGGFVSNNQKEKS